jgi:hypothetical protein
MWLDLSLSEIWVLMVTSWWIGASAKTVREFVPTKVVLVTFVWLDFKSHVFASSESPAL